MVSSVKLIKKMNKNANTNSKIKQRKMLLFNCVWLYNFQDFPEKDGLLSMVLVVKSIFNII